MVEKYPKRVIVRLTKQQHRQIARLAKIEGRSISFMMRKAVDNIYDTMMSKKGKE